MEIHHFIYLLWLGVQREMPPVCSRWQITIERVIACDEGTICDFQHQKAIQVLQVKAKNFMV